MKGSGGKLFFNKETQNLSAVAHRSAEDGTAGAWMENEDEVLSFNRSYS